MKTYFNTLVDVICSVLPSTTRSEIIVKVAQARVPETHSGVAVLPVGRVSTEASV